MPTSNNRRAHNVAAKQGWYAHFDVDLRDSVSCDVGDPGAHVDLIRGLDYLRAGKDRGPATRETVSAAKGKNKAKQIGMAGINQPL